MSIGVSLCVLQLSLQQELDTDIRLRREIEEAIEFELRVSRLNTVIQVRYVRPGRIENVLKVTRISLKV